MNDKKKRTSTENVYIILFINVSYEMMCWLYKMQTVSMWRVTSKKKKNTQQTNTEEKQKLLNLINHRSNFRTAEKKIVNQNRKFTSPVQNQSQSIMILMTQIIFYSIFVDDDDADEDCDFVVYIFADDVVVWLCKIV